MTQMTTTQLSRPVDSRPALRRRLRAGIVGLSAAIAVSGAFGPGPIVVARLGTGDAVGSATVSASDTITSAAVLAEVPAAVRDSVSKIG